MQALAVRLLPVRLPTVARCVSSLCNAVAALSAHSFLKFIFLRK